jgi:hypothetical protein
LDHAPDAAIAHIGFSKQNVCYTLPKRARLHVSVEGSWIASWLAGWLVGWLAGWTGVYVSALYIAWSLV